MAIKFSEILVLYEEWKNEWNRLREIEKPIILFGAGSTSEFILETFRKHEIEPRYFCDNNPNKQGVRIGNLEVISLDSAINQYKESVFYITTQLYYREIKNQLLRVGIPEDSIIQYDLICQFEWEKNYLSFIKSHEKELHAFIDQLADEYSKEVVLSRMAFLITRKRDYVVNVRGKVQYFEEEIIDYKSIHYFVDVGVYTGDTVLEFLKYNDLSACQVHGFEMDDELYKCAKENLRNLGDRVKLEKKAVSDKDGYQYMTGELGRMRSIAEGTFFGGEQEQFFYTTCKLDTVLEKQRTNTFIKMDIEGAEYNAIVGGKSFIQNNQPTMAICIYHKAEDILEIPKLLKSYYSNYRFYVRHYSDNQTETVLYAVSI